MNDLTDISLGMWIDLPKSLVLTSEFFAWYCEELRFDMLAIMIDDSDMAVEFSWSPKDVEMALRYAETYAAEIGLTTWPYPIKWQLDRMREKMMELMSVGPIAEWETDQEFNWGEDDVDGFEPIRDEFINDDGVEVIQMKSAYDVAGDYLVNVKREVCALQDARNAMTTFTYHRENSSLADTSGEGDIVIAQAYATDERDHKPVHFDHRFGPGRMQVLTLDRTIQIPGVQEKKVELGVGHAAWNQDNFKRKILKDGKKQWIIEDPKTAMLTSFLAAYNYPVKVLDHRWWSAKFCYPKSRRYNAYAEEFLRTLRAA